MKTCIAICYCSCRHMLTRALRCDPGGHKATGPVYYCLPAGPYEWKRYTGHPESKGWARTYEISSDMISNLLILQIIHMSLTSLISVDMW